MTILRLKITAKDRPRAIRVAVLYKLTRVYREQLATKSSGSAAGPKRSSMSIDRVWTGAQFPVHCAIARKQCEIYFILS